MRPIAAASMTLGITTTLVIREKILIGIILHIFQLLSFAIFTHIFRPNTCVELIKKRISIVNIIIVFAFHKHIYLRFGLDF